MSLALPSISMISGRASIAPFCKVSCTAISEVEQDKKNLQSAKMSLLRSVFATERGFRASVDQRGVVEEAMVEVETYNAGIPLNLSSLNGTWVLQYTSAPDVVSILQAAELPTLRIGQIYQKFECENGRDEGKVVNIVKWSIPGILQEEDGAKLFVTAGFRVVRPRTIQLEFKEARLGEIMIGAELQTFLAPAILPRTFLNLEALQFFRSLDLKFPLLGRQSRGKRVLGLLYYLTYLDNDMLLGRALGSGGVFLFGRTQPL